jgi:hypothetical protein
VDEVDKDGYVLCRFCRFSALKSTPGAFSPVECTMGDNPGPVDPDVAECEEGRMAHESEHWDRKQWDR